MEPKHHPIEKEHHLPPTSLTVGSMLMFHGVYFAPHVATHVEFSEIVLGPVTVTVEI